MNGSFRLIQQPLAHNETPFWALFNILPICQVLWISANWRC